MRKGSISDDKIKHAYWEVLQIVFFAPWIKFVIKSYYIRSFSKSNTIFEKLKTWGFQKCYRLSLKIPQNVGKWTNSKGESIKHISKLLKKEFKMANAISHKGPLETF